MKELNDLFLKLRHYFFPHSIATNTADCTRCKPGSNPSTDNSSGAIKFDNTTKKEANNSSSYSTNTPVLSNSPYFELTDS